MLILVYCFFQKMPVNKIPSPTTEIIIDIVLSCEYLDGGGKLGVANIIKPSSSEIEPTIMRIYFNFILKESFIKLLST